MLRLAAEDAYSVRSAPLWFILAFQSGLLNSYGFLNTGTFVSHHTGIGTQIGIATGTRDLTVLAELVSLPIAFILGAALCTLILDFGDQTKVKWNLRSVLIGMLALLGVAYFFQTMNIKHKDGVILDNHYVAMLAVLLCFICGVQNALTVWMSHGKIRVTHITGLITDIGTHLPLMFIRHKKGARLDEPVRFNLVRVGILLSFLIGSIFSAIAYNQIHLHAIIPAMVIMVALLTQSFFMADPQELAIKDSAKQPHTSADQLVQK